MPRSSSSSSSSASSASPASISRANQHDSRVSMGGGGQEDDDHGFQVFLHSDPAETDGRVMTWEVCGHDVIIGRKTSRFFPEGMGENVSRAHLKLSISLNPPTVTLMQLSSNPTWVFSKFGDERKLIKGEFYVLEDGDSFCFVLNQRFRHILRTRGGEGSEEFSQDDPSDATLEPMDVQLGSLQSKQSIMETSYLNETPAGHKRTRKRKHDTPDDHLKRSSKRWKEADTTTRLPTPLKRQQSLFVPSEHDCFAIKPEELEITKCIAAGSCGEVSVGKWNGTPVAIKKIMRSLIHDDALKEFKEETNTLRTLRHPNVVLFMGVCSNVEKEEFCIVTEYMERGSLTDVLSDKSIKITVSRIIGFALDAAQGMNYLHKRSPPIIHRDLKSMNLLVDKYFHVKVSDFGLSTKARGTLQRADTMCGTVPWLAPEVLSGDGYTIKADVYSFGITLWEMVTRSEPYRGLSEQQVLAGIRGKTLRPRIPRSCPQQLRDLIVECWHESGEKRPSFASIVERLDEMRREVCKRSSGDESSSSLLFDSPAHSSQSRAKALRERFLRHDGGGPSHEWTIPSHDVLLGELIAEGDIMMVYEAEYNRQQVVVKILKDSDNEMAVQEFQEHMQLASTLRMPQIVYFYGGGTEPQAFYVTELMPRGSIANILDSTDALPMNLVIRLAVNAARALNALHSWSPTVLHRNCKPSNFLVDTTYGVKVCDVVDQPSMLRFLSRYSAPETIDGEYTEFSDVYSFGLILWEMMIRSISGKRILPYADIGGDVMAILKQCRLGARPSIPEQCNVLLAELIERCCAGPPSERPRFDDVLVMLQQI